MTIRANLKLLLTIILATSLYGCGSDNAAPASSDDDTTGTSTTPTVDNALNWDQGNWDANNWN